MWAFLHMVVLWNLKLTPTLGYVCTTAGLYIGKNDNCYRTPSKRKEWQLQR